MLPTLVRSPHTGDRLRLSRAWPRSAGHALLEYVDANGDATAGQWFADRDRLVEVTARTPVPASAVIGDNVLLQPDGADRKLPALGDELRHRGGRLVAHRAERRAVVAHPREFVKIVRPGKADDIVARTGIADELLGDLVGVAAVGAHDTAAGVLRFGRLPGRSLHDVGADPTVSSGRFAAAWHRLGVLLRRMAGRDPGDAVLATHGPQQEQEVTARWLDLAAQYRLLPFGAAERAAELLVDVDAEATAVVHRDLHDKQVFVAGDGSLSMIDLDTLALGDPALDIANLLVHIELRRDQGLLTPARAELATAALRAGAGVAERPGLAPRVDAYATAARLRLLAVYAFRPSRRGGWSKVEPQDGAAGRIVADVQPAAGTFGGASRDVES